METVVMKNCGRSLSFAVHAGGRTRDETVTIERAVIAGWTGRDPAAVEKHIKELEAVGVRRPASTPIFYRVAASRLTTGDAIQASGESSSGEVEFVLVRSGGRIYVGVGSDHTDRHVETYNVTVSKQMCDKPVAPELWNYDDVKGHWDRLLIRAWAHFPAGAALYQEGSVDAMLAPDELMRRVSPEGLPEQTLMFCGTLAAKGGIRPASRFEFELEDPVLKRSIRHGYDVASLPIVDAFDD
jgi:hypothetical protein